MASSEKVSILLADEDALRRDGLAAVLHGAPNFEVVAQCPDGEAALDEIRRLRPDVAIVDLNLPKLHGIEMVRRVRSEALGTKIVVLSGSNDDGIIREVVRAGGDGYLLKNGPARHLIDAISYVRDGGQYFSPQLRRDGLDRRILEEPARPREHEQEAADHEADRDRDELRRVPRDARYGRSRRSGGTREHQRLRERLRAESNGENLEERDYEILDMMAEGIRPIIDRLEDIENRIGDMEAGEAPVPGNVRGWLDRQMADTFADTHSGREVALSRSMNEIEARLPQMIEEAVTSRFQSMASRLQQDIEETHVRTLETFVRNIQVKLVQRVSALEGDMSKQAEAMDQLRAYSQRTEDNLSRLITGVDKLTQELPKRLTAPAAEPVVRTISEPKPTRRRSSRRFSARIFWLALLAVAAIVAVIIYVPWSSVGGGNNTARATAAPGVSETATAAPAAKVAPPPLGSDTKTRMQAAAQYADNKEYSLAENIYKEVLKAEPRNYEAMKALASVLYREDKIEESAAILEKLPRTN